MWDFSICTAGGSLLSAERRARARHGKGPISNPGLCPRAWPAAPPPGSPRAAVPNCAGADPSPNSDEGIQQGSGMSWPRQCLGGARPDVGDAPPRRPYLETDSRWSMCSAPISAFAEIPASLPAALAMSCDRSQDSSAIAARRCLRACHGTAGARTRLNFQPVASRQRQVEGQDGREVFPESGENPATGTQLRPNSDEAAIRPTSRVHLVQKLDAPARRHLFTVKRYAAGSHAGHTARGSADETVL